MFTATLRTRLAALRLIRPRAIAHLVKTAEESRRELRDLARAVKRLQEHVTAMKAGHEQFLERLQTQQTESFESAARHRAALVRPLEQVSETARSRLLHPAAPRPEMGIPHLSSVSRAARRRRVLGHGPVPGR